MTTALRLTDYALSYTSVAGDVRILDRINLSIARGEVLGLVGESGSAKSSLANAIMRDLPGVVARETGKIELAQDDLTAMTQNQLDQVRGRRIAMVFQNAATALNPVQTLGDHLLETLAVQEPGLDAGSRQKRAIELMALVGLPDPQGMMSRYPHQVSGGEKQRVVLALAFAADPELILFDEPTSALDATTAATLLDLFRDLQASTGVAALFISHDLGTVAGIADRVAVIYGGRIVEEAPADVLFANPRHPYTRSLVASLPRPSDSRTNRSLNTTAAKPAPRLTAPPKCIFAQSCSAFKAGVCDSEVVDLKLQGDRLLACARGGFEGADISLQRAPVRPVAQDAPILTLKGLKVSYGRDKLLHRVLGRETEKVQAVLGADLTLHRGETLALVGESGCGKSTLARALAGLVPFQGQLALDGEVITKLDTAYRSRVQMIFQNPDSSLNPRHTIETILSRPLSLYRNDVSKGARPAEVAAILERVSLPASYATRYPHELSGGEKQRVAIARAIAARPEVIICDEVTSGLDAAVQASIVALLRDIQAESGTALIFITHDLAILRHIAHKIAVMYLGEIAEQRPMAGIDQGPYHPYTEALLSSSPSLDPYSATRRVRLTGALPNRTKRLQGCPFESRCPHRLGDVCRTLAPPVSAAGDHTILCHIDPDGLRKLPPVWTFNTADLETEHTA
ncbi:ABC transporter ATP-binding protein [Sulfitobacter sp.]|uniref:ABC transporter ATP-binding protein n=1 Tax=Sulfitobacter sp. TaxID=1903071 RepID=UPI00329A7281